MPSTVTILPSQLPLPGMKWTPIRGPQGEGVPARAGLPEEARKKIVKSAWKVLGRGVAPDAGPPQEAGLVVGYVQSGKTLSFTTAIGLARDNRFPLVIVVAGTKTSLHAQSAERLTRDLAVDAGEGAREWRRLANPTADDAQTIEKTIEDWSDPDLDDDERATLLITVLKQQDHLGRLTNVLTGLASKLANVPVLVIDDEADQAGLNAKVRKGEESTIYRCLRLLRAALPRHTYLLYTATPQAPLLININSALSPSFVHVLEPGDGYVGGAEFFAPGSPYVKAIPPGEVLDESNLPTEPPPSLIEALRFFFVGLAATLAASGQGPKQRRSMMVHPSRMRLVHGTLRQWLVDAVENWRTIEALPATDPDRQQFEQEFRQAWNEAHATTPGIVGFNAMMEKLRRALRRTQVIEFNTNGRPKTPEIQWRDADGWILIGGQALDRGFTVDSLTVTYMPRGVGMGNADAIQQRARFFGYKRKYLGLCRVYLEGSTISAFQNYVQHEEIMRAELERVEESGISLRDWTRQFVLSPALRPCRSSVISVGDDYVRGGAGGWTQQREAKLTDDLRTANAEAFDRLTAELTCNWDDTYASRSEAQRHQVCRDVPLRRIAEFLADYNLPDARDTAALTALLVTVGAVLEDEPDATANVYRMRPDYVGGRREVDADGFLPGNFLQGRTGDGREAYPGDGFFKAPDRISVQLHRFDLREGTGPNAPLVASDAPLLAIHVPRQLALPTLVQPQSGTAP